MANSSVKIETRGIIFDRVRTAAILEEFLADAKNHVARAGEAMLGNYGHMFFKNPTGNWESNIRTDIVSTDRVISDNVVYNSWLEGVSERNKTTRFKGYKLWRLTTQDLNKQKSVICEFVLKNGKYMERLNGV
jgi:hypothetical protein